jgi:electron transfer flavoprotein alpha subunit
MILVLVDHDRGVLDPLSTRALTAARKIDSDIQAVVIGSQGAQVAAEVGKFGAKVMHLVTNAELNDYAPMASGRALSQLVDTLKPAAVIAAGSPRGNEQLAHLAAFKDLPMAAECTNITIGAPHKVVRARWAGNLLEDANVHSDLLIASVMALAFEPEEVGVNAEVKEITVNLSPEDTVVKVLDRVGESSSGGVTLTDAKVIVSGGRGVGGPEGFAVIEELASALGGAVGCSRVVTASGWRPHSEQVGQTGSKVAPNLYLACGISGAMQHIAGMKNSKHIVAINTDPEATIFRYADYGIIGDLHQVLPKLIEAVKAAR